jgi:D-glycero-D-manno-heptose 1,7-bisphosphate phosphatase
MSFRSWLSNRYFMHRAVFLDRDGVINRKAPEGEYITRWEQMHFLSGVAPAISLLNEAGFRVIVVSNQRCVAKRLITTADLNTMHQRMADVLGESGARIDGIYYCPHENQPACGCRKPAAGMLLQAAREHRIDLAASWMIGDSESDVQAGRTAGCKTARLLLSPDEASECAADLIAPSLLDVVGQILNQERCRADLMKSAAILPAPSGVNS